MFSTLSRASNFLASSLSPVDTVGATPTQTKGLLTRGIDDLEGMVKVGSALGPSDLPALLDAVRNLSSKGIDDKLFLLEKLLFLMSSMPADSPTNISMQQFFIDTLYKDLPHPPSAYLKPMPQTLPEGMEPESRSYNYRSTNGTSYSPSMPTLGMAGAPYARSVPTTRTIPPNALPDPGLAFDLLLSRPSSPSAYTPHPGGLSAMFFGVANLVIHSIFDTSRARPGCNDTSSYIDLSPLYGNDVSEMKRKTSELRRGDGTGRMWDDVWADERLVFMPPQTAVVLVLLCRNHNYIAEKILAINERGTFPPPSSLTDEKLAAQDEEIFQRARLVNCMTFAKVVLYDYVGGILGLTRDGSPFRLDLPEQIRSSDHSISPTGQGNQISAEFNLLYRWHASTSAPDAQWITGVMSGMCQGLGGGVTPSTITPGQFVRAAGKFMRAPESVKDWTVGGLKRDPATGRFSDSDIANIIMSATENPAHAFGARRTPEAMRVVEIMTIMQGREWGCCTLNEFRKFFGLRPYANFQEWNKDPEIYVPLYHDIENLELHVGLQAEESKPPMPGAGLCPSYTMSRAILADAVTLVRSDPYLCTEFNPYNATAWGFQDCNIDANDGSYGGMFSKLLLRHLPNDFLPGSAYTHFPLMVPKTMFSEMAKRGDPAVAKYDWNRPTTAAGPGLPTRVGVSMAERVYGTPVQRVERLVGAPGVKINWSLVKNAMMANVASKEWTDGFARITTDLIRAKSVVRPGVGVKQIDIVQDVLNLVPVYFLANDVLGLPLKTVDNPGGVYRPQQLYEMFADVSSYVLFHQDSTQEWSQREKALECAETVIGQIKANLDRLDYGVFSISGLLDTISDYFTSKTDRSGAFLTSLLQSGKKARLSHDVIAASLFAGVVPSAAQYSSALAQIVDFYLDEKQTDDKQKLVEMASFASSAADTQFLSFAQKAIQSTPPVSVASQNGTQPTSTNGTTTAVSNALANTSGATFGPGTEGLMSSKFLDKTAPFVLRTIFGLKNVRRAPGSSGSLPKFVQDIEGVPQTFYIDNTSGLSPFPTGLLLQYDV